MKKKVSLIVLVALMAFTLPPQKHITVYLIGDSTMANKEVKAYPETGWGMPFYVFFDSSVTVNNRAKNGRSTGSFMKEGLWQPVVNNLQPDDYVLIQFGHNDEVTTKKTYTTPEQFRNNLIQYVTDSRSKKAIPVLITPVARRKFDSSGHITDTHAQYAAIVRSVAQQYKVPLIDLDTESMALLQQYGPENSKWLYNYLAPGEHPNYPEGRADDTHFSELGARKMAEIVLADIRKLNLDLANRIVKPPVKK